MATASVLLGISAWASDHAIRPGTYEITVETTMPHLEENLRYATTRERRCLRDDELSSVFTILQHTSLAGCKLVGENRRDDTLRYLLVCENPQVATGTARFETDPLRIIGVLEVKMGGKNMTFAQRIRATRTGECH